MTTINMSNINTVDCPNATSPVNISMSSIDGPCVLKCDYNHDYGIYSPNITNKENYLSLNYSGKSNPVKYNDENYTVTEIRIYHPSLHTYKNNNADGEVLIIHNGPGKNLIVSVPFISGGKTDKGSAQLGKLLDEAALRTPSKTDTVTASIGNFSLDDFIPERKGYYSYTGTLPYTPCNGTYSYIVFNIDDALNINKSVLDKLKKIIKTTKVDLKSNRVFHNKNGANSKSNDDNIYIDCQPVNSEGEILVQTGPDGSSSINTSPNNTLEQIEPLLYVLLGLSVAYGIVYGGRYIFKKMRSS
jgi:carbonic anhydrase